MRNIVAELADKVKMLESKALTMSVLVRHLADKGAIWRSSSRVRRGVTRKNAGPMGPLGKNAGNHGVFPEAQAAPLEPLGKNAGDCDKVPGSEADVVALLGGNGASLARTEVVSQQAGMSWKQRKKLKLMMKRRR